MRRPRTALGSSSGRRAAAASAEGNAVTPSCVSSSCNRICTHGAASLGGAQHELQASHMCKATYTEAPQLRIRRCCWPSAAHAPKEGRCHKAASKLPGNVAQLLSCQTSVSSACVCQGCAHGKRWAAPASVMTATASGSTGLLRSCTHCTAWFGRSACTAACLPSKLTPTLRSGHCHCHCHCHCCACADTLTGDEGRSSHSCELRRLKGRLGPLHMLERRLHDCLPSSVSQTRPAHDRAGCLVVFLRLS